MPKLKDVLEIILYLTISAALLATLQSCAALTAPAPAPATATATATATAPAHPRPQPGTLELRSNHHRQLITVPQDTIIYYGKKIMFIIVPGADSFTARYYEEE